MNQLKKIEKRLSKLSRLQKQLDKKKRKVGRLVAKNKKKQNRVRRLVKEAQQTVPPAKKTMVKKAAIGFVIGTVLGVVVTKIVKYVKNNGCCCKLHAQADADALAENFQTEESHAEYDKASLEELEDALLRVENELDEVSAAIENAKK